MSTPAASTHLLTELRHADHIIKAMLNAMTIEQQARVGAQLDADGVAGDGITRHHERRAVIVAASATPQEPAALTAREQALLLAYRATDDRGQARIAWTASHQAGEWPRRAKPALRLVAGGAK